MGEASRSHLRATMINHKMSPLKTSAFQRALVAAIFYPLCLIILVFGFNPRVMGEPVYEAKPQAVVAELRHGKMDMRIGYPALIEADGKSPALKLSSQAKEAVGFEVKIIREQDGEVVLKESGSLPAGESFLATQENAAAPVPGVYQILIKYDHQGKISYDTFSFTVGLKELRAHLPGDKNFSQIVFPGRDGKLIYIPDHRGNHMPDFSNVGYMQGAEKMPKVPVKIKLSALKGDNSAQIQEAIDKVSRMQPDSKGFRGAILLQAGVYEVTKPLSITTSGVVLQGEGPGEDRRTFWLEAEKWLDPSKKNALQDFKNSLTSKSSTILIYPASDGNFITIEGGELTTEVNQAVEIADHYVPVGTFTIHVDNAKTFAIGDSIMVRRRANAAWITQIGMDQLPDHPTKGKCEVWSGPLYFERDYQRTITSIEGNQITLHAPIVCAIEDRWGGGCIFKYNDSEHVEKIGVEGMRIILFSPFQKNELSHMRGSAVYLNDAKNCWVRDVVAEYFTANVFTVNGSQHTVQDSSCLMADQKPVLGR